MKRLHQTLVVVGIGAAALYFAFRDVEWERLVQQLQRVDTAQFFLGLAAFFGLHVCRCIRWGRMIQAIAPTVRFRSYFSVASVGFLLINILPFRLGEFARPYLLYEREGVPFGSGMATVVVERVLDVLALAGLFLGVLLFAGIPATDVVVAGRSYDVVAVARTALLAAGLPVSLALVGLLWMGDRAPLLVERITRPLNPRLARWTTAFLGTFLHALRSMGSLRRALGLLSWTVVAWGLNALSMMLMAQAFAFPFDPGFWDGATILVCICVALILPSPPGFAGVFELAVAIALGLYLVGPSEAAAFSLVVHTAQFGLLAAIGTTFLVLDGISVRRLVAMLATGEAAEGGRAEPVDTNRPALDARGLESDDLVDP